MLISIWTFDEKRRVSANPSGTEDEVVTYSDEATGKHSQAHQNVTQTPAISNTCIALRILNCQNLIKPNIIQEYDQRLEIEAATTSQGCF